MSLLLHSPGSFNGLLPFEMIMIRNGNGAFKLSLTFLKVRKNLLSTVFDFFIYHENVQTHTRAAAICSFLKLTEFKK